MQQYGWSILLLKEHYENLGCINQTVRIVVEAQVELCQISGDVITMVCSFLLRIMTSPDVVKCIMGNVGLSVFKSRKDDLSLNSQPLLLSLCFLLTLVHLPSIELNHRSAPLTFQMEYGKLFPNPNVPLSATANSPTMVGDHVYPLKHPQINTATIGL